MGNTGKSLEEFVKKVEGLLVPKGFSVELNEKVYEDGVQIAEFDIVIEGKIGSAAFRGLIECRDRPSKGAQPRGWIEQLIGRRQANGFSKVTAVSSTGFSEGAIELAKKSDIELRNVTELAPELIEKWFPSPEMMVVKRVNNCVRASLIVSEDESQDRQEALVEVFEKETGEPFLRHISNGENVTVAQAFLMVVTQIGNLFKDLKAGDKPKPISVRASYPSDDGHFVVDTALGPIRIREIFFRGDLSIVEERVPAESIRNYADASDETDFMTSVGFGIETGNLSLELSFNKDAETGEVAVVVTKKKR